MYLVGGWRQRSLRRGVRSEGLFASGVVNKKLGPTWTTLSGSVQSTYHFSIALLSIIQAKLIPVVSMLDSSRVLASTSE